MRPYFLLVPACLLLACNEKIGNDANVQNSSQVLEETNIDTLTNYWPCEYDTIKSDISIRIDNDYFQLNTYVYSLNDSSIHRFNEAYQKKVYQDIYHNYESSIYLTGSQDTLLMQILKKEIFKDIFPPEFYQQAVIKSVEYKAVRSNQLFFHVELIVPDTDWIKSAEMSIFFRTSKKGRLSVISS
ncbi:DUF4738 domain-containing protein [Croceimicrobium hydrocarbonivorans]|uniref:DUF4738 domain-containing protein n=1 Tax=Croceimicrobium hydrocarbonivorans TaxID=2761580 RepID=A0A7H0VC24_9FLAO|nr:DUF4738 domain-containing protein [Croceimicrobium hydrocarbonivorans]QNR23272.1 DUF4738 domain-containing protein [Croceimicrobium hydrocarbonivorans]